MKSFLFVLILSMAGIAHGSAMGYGERSCRSLDEQRGVLRGREVCIVETSCYRYPLSNPNAGTRIQRTAYCRPDSRNYCLDAQDCLADVSLTESDIPKIRPKYDSGDDCNCSQVRGSRSGGYGGVK